MTDPANRDYARKPELIGDLSYLEWMKKPPFRALQWIREQKESEFKKPYREDEHVPMEHWADSPFPVFTFPPFPNFPGPIPGPDSPWILHPGEEEEEEWEGVCPGYVMCDPGNPTTIVAGETAIVNVLSCPPPATLEVEIHEDNYFNIRSVIHIGGTDIWAIVVEAEADACGTCTIIATDPGGGRRGGPWSAICYLRCTNGAWVSKGNYCGLSGSVLCDAADAASADYELISGNRRQTQITNFSRHQGILPAQGHCQWCQDWYDGNVPDLTPNCIDGDHTVPGYLCCSTNEWTCGFSAGGVACRSEFALPCNDALWLADVQIQSTSDADLEYFEWECP